MTEAQLRLHWEKCSQRFETAKESWSQQPHFTRGQCKHSEGKSTACPTTALGGRSSLPVPVSPSPTPPSLADEWFWLLHRQRGHPYCQRREIKDRLTLHVILCQGPWHFPINPWCNLQATTNPMSYLGG